MYNFTLINLEIEIQEIKRQKASIPEIEKTLWSAGMCQDHRADKARVENSLHALKRIFSLLPLQQTSALLVVKNTRAEK